MKYTLFFGWMVLLASCHLILPDTVVVPDPVPPPPVVAPVVVPPPPPPPPAVSKKASRNSKENLKARIVGEVTFIHNVYIWLKEDVTVEQRKDFELNGLHALTKVKSIHHSYYGPPAGTPRDVVDNSYDYAFVSMFRSSAGQDAYQADPIHKKFIEDYKDLWTRIQIYDNVVSANPEEPK